MGLFARCAAGFLLAVAAAGVDAQGVSPEALPATVPMEIRHGKPYVMVVVNGKGPFRFILDTGTGGDAIVTAELADQLGLPQVGEARLNDPTGLGGRSAPLVSIDSLRIASVDFRAIKAVRHNLPAGDGSCQGMLGFTLFRDYLLTLDYPTGRMSLLRGSLVADKERSVLDFRMPDGIPIISMRVGDRLIDAEIDSGGAGLSLPEQVAASLRFSSQPEIFGKGESLSTRFQIKAGKLATDVHVGQFTFAGPWVEVNPAFPLANFGSWPLQHFAVTFDQRNLLIRFVAARKRIVLGLTPAPMRLANQPAPNQPDGALVPVG